MVTIGLSRTVSEINGDFRRQFSHPRVFNAPAEGELSAQESEETRMMGLPDGRKSFRIVLAVLIPACDGHPASHPATLP